MSMFRTCFELPTFAIWFVKEQEKFIKRRSARRGSILAVSELSLRQTASDVHFLVREDRSERSAPRAKFVYRLRMGPPF